MHGEESSRTTARVGVERPPTWSVLLEAGGKDFADEVVAPPGLSPALARVIELMGQVEMVRAFNELGVLLDSEDWDPQPRAVLLLARFNEARGEVEPMLRAYGVAATSEHPEIAPLAS
ncbi:hypothetical protein ACIRYZ_18200 [Kitasatospora sp. NPDC101155]|uniref:hypothetical protein n=1 Tax=Kitasatospora sp. NPDC101155 TaxID=3364097 RepID=UPI00380D4235